MHGRVTPRASLPSCCPLRGGGTRSVRSRTHGKGDDGKEQRQRGGYAPLVVCAGPRAPARAEAGCYVTAHPPAARNARRRSRHQGGARRQGRPMPISAQRQHTAGYITETHRPAAPSTPPLYTDPPCAVGTGPQSGGAAHTFFAALPPPAPGWLLSPPLGSRMSDDRPASRPPQVRKYGPARTYPAQPNEPT